ncbi:V-set and immunoglobulin domain-containing protein 10 [Aulostomus maculatus]
MKGDSTAALLLLCFLSTAVVSADDSTETTLTASPGDIVLLPCYTAGNVTPSVTTWLKDGRTVASGGASEAAGGLPVDSTGGQRLTVLHDGSLNIRGVIAGDEGNYLCNSTLPGDITFRARVLLQVASGPVNVSISINPVTVLSNGTLVTYRGSSISFDCFGSSYPSQQLTWAFRGASSSNNSLMSTSGLWLEYKMEEIQPSAQGVYTCMAQNLLSHRTANKSTQLLVYYVPDRHPECMWAPAQDSSHVQFNCTWFGAYPSPTLLWVEDQKADSKRRIFASEVTDSLLVTMNRSLLSSGQTLTCAVQHLAVPPGTEKSCSLTLKPPNLESEPLVTALEATSVTLICTESVSTPPAATEWRRGPQQENIIPGSKYVLTEDGPVFKLTIHNVSKDDEGVYFCRSENPLAVRELEVYLTVKTSSTYTGAIIGVFIAALIVGSAAIVAKTVYSSRHRICLGDCSRATEDDGGDVLSLVESEDELFFQDAVPRLPPITNGHHTTLVQIHQIPLSDHVDTGTPDAGTQQQEDSAQTEEPADLVTF